MSTLFVADIHLCEQEPVITAGFMHFLRTRAIAAKALYILGDLFEVWIGDDDPSPLHHEIAISLKTLTERGISCYFIHGNRDFLLGKHYAATCGITLLPTQRVVQLEGLRIVILHGDILCTVDESYQRFRRQVHQRWLQQLFLTLPLWLRLYIVHRMRINSLRINTSKTADTMDVNAKSVIAVMDNARATVMIHGHTHRPAIHQLPGKRLRAVLGAWYNQGSVIEVSTSGIILHKFPFFA
ncbi:UDP-2,3-diacylglucosamine hydrolase [Candidatus Gullanella endobia]|uniref:UDP-2,3-diacylglucosamine hydrolase n=1 Tax=Candidatus Gullanella endobia TaxID=1070130 RepID=A0A143WQ72_9ENTR|nr:UDP-2,3-diacylglucosamine diphosphatase [Candidatus Gullanella endobia]CUX95860.1 UDP-2,3-diacylglucosamine hydrolase [Candidatus Gullanella endobia]